MRRPRTITAAGALGALLLLLVSSIALAADLEEERQAYKAQVEPICKQNREANERVLKGVKKNIKAGKLKLAATQFAKGANALKKARTQLAAVPKPATDSARLTKWLGYVKTEVELFERVSEKLKAGDQHGAQRMALQLTSTVNRANNTVLAYEFRYCRVQTSQFL
jgi:formiminotetrahydrofolate cyclodeaminase